MSARTLQLLSLLLATLVARLGSSQYVAPAGVIVPGSNPKPDAGRVAQTIYPYDSFTKKDNPQNENSNIIDNKRFIESVSSRCMASTLLEDPDAMEPNFVIVRDRSEVRVNATAPVEAIEAAGFDARLPTIILVHGFTQSYPDTDWLRKTRALYEVNYLVDKENMVIMDWGIASRGSYTQVAARTSAMGSFLANFLMKLFELGSKREHVHIVGHSLGAHIAGFAGKRIRPRIGRITGLDVAGPCFGKFFANSANARLAADDAFEVDVYHYDDDFLGLAGQIGQFDVMVNGGSSQPGAVDNINAMAQALVTMVFRRNRPLSESHTRSTEVSTSQLSSSSCQMVAYECRDWPAFLSGECGLCDSANSQCFDMGFHYQYANQKPRPLRQANPGKQLFIATTPTSQFCLQHFQVVVNFEPSPELVNMSKSQGWKIYLELVNAMNQRSNITIVNQVKPEIFTHLLLSAQPPQPFKSAILQVRRNDNTPVHLQRDKENSPARPYTQPVRVQSVQINFMSSIEPEVRRAFSKRLCPSGWYEAQNSIDGSSVSKQGLNWLTLSEC